MRLMNADRFAEEIQYYKREAGWGESWNRCLDAVLEAIQDAPTIAPEELPIVKELRANIVILEAAVNSNHNAEDMLMITKLLTETANLREKLAQVIKERDLAVDCINEIEYQSRKFSCSWVDNAIEEYESALKEREKKPI